MIDWDSLVLSPCEKIFGESEPVLYEPASYESFSTTGIFDKAYREQSSVGDVIGMTIEVPVLGIRLANFTNPPKQGDQLTITRTNITYVVKEVRPDGHGSAKLMLNFVRNNAQC